MEKEVEVHGEGEMEDVHGEGEVDGVHVEGEVEGEVDAVQVEEDGDDVEITQGQVQELEDEFQRVHENIQDLFDKVDRATNVEATDARISTSLVQDVVHRTYSNPTSTCEFLYLALRDLHIAILLDLDGINLALHLSFYMDAVHLSFSMDVIHLSFSMNLNFLLHLASTSLVQGIAKQMALLLYTKEWG
ncbi:hypothetical protein QYE76_023404 [Lolium multiflorum]|uniref:Uncharacterized protein n=1 Tax=Lolium multiflorum TaxID=4521 RepID=A0AAD8RBC0_LOLMU|nr:hypothetical protein QYE76_023404 [Lolium multiflorum]